jgi:hypothetical protein
MSADSGIASSHLLGNSDRLIDLDGQVEHGGRSSSRGCGSTDFTQGWLGALPAMVFCLGASPSIRRFQIDCQ